MIMMRDPPSTLTTDKHPLMPHLQCCHCALCVMNRSIALLQKRSEWPCRAWQDGYCTLGDLCWFRHDPNDWPKHLKPTIDHPLCSCSICLRHRRQQCLTKIDWPCMAQTCSGDHCIFSHDPQIKSHELQVVTTGHQATAPHSQLQNGEAKLRPRPHSLAESLFTIQHKVSSTQVSFGPGALAERIALQSDPSHVVVSNLPLDATESEVKSLFTQPGFQNFYIHKLETDWDGLHKTAQVVFDEGTANKAVIALDGIDFRDEKLRLQLHSGRLGQMLDASPPESDANTLHISWRVPHTTAIIIYKDAAEARTKLAALENTIHDGQAIRIKMKRSFHPKLSFMSTVAKISGLPVDATRSSVREMTGCFAVCSIKRRKYDANRAYYSVRKDVDKACFAFPSDYRRDESQLKSGLFGVQAQFATWEQARRVRDKLATRRLSYIGGKRLALSLELPFRYAILVPAQQYKAQEKTLKSVMDSCKNNQLAQMHIISTDTNNPTRIEVFGSNKNSVGALKVRLEQLLAGERELVWDEFFNSEGGAAFLDTLSRDTGVHLRPDRESCAVRVFGEAPRVLAARQAVIAKVNNLGSPPVQLDQESVDYFKTVGVEILKEIVGKENVLLDIDSSTPTIQISGGADAQHVLRGLIVQSKNRVDVGSSSTAANCPICFDSVSNPVHLECGHAYCHGCIRHFLTTAADVGIFPLCCATCKAPMPIPVLRQFLSPPRMKQLLDASFNAYVHNHPDEYRYCPTPSCPELYRVTGRDKHPSDLFDCPSCFRSMCSACHGIPHQGMTCAEWSLSQDSKQQDKLLERWADKKKEKVKRCPKCSVLIEKDFGCNHVKCRCGTHICWKCMQTFSSGIYDHLSSVHGGAFEH